MNGKERRSQIDTETVRGLLLVHGGGVVALLAFLPTILGDSAFEPLVRAVLWGIVAFIVGLLTTLIHNHLRRRCSLKFEQERPVEPCRWPPLSWIPLKDDPYCVCRASWLMLWVSFASFAAGGGLVVWGGFKVLGA